MTDLLHEVHIAPSILSADFAALAADVETVLNAGARVIHVDVMDGHFVPNITIGPLVVAALQSLVHGAGALLDVHLMIEHPERYVADLRGGRRRRHRRAPGGLRAPAPRARPDPRVRRLRRRGAEPGDARRDAGRGARPLRPRGRHVGEPRASAGRASSRRRWTRSRRARAYLPESVAIEVDGGVSAVNAGELVAAGANWLVAGSSVFGGADISERYAALAQAAGEAV